MIRNGLLCALVLAGMACAAQEAPVVGVTGGSIRGALTAGGGAVFKSVPFAEPPVGDLRWREPRPPRPWKGVLDATAFRPACVQLSEGWNAADAANNSEDCLYLNIAVPQWPPKKKAPVMFWIHGGSNTAGSGEAAAIDRRALVEHGLVFVTVNYRLGMLGFLVHPELTRESPHHASGNYGLMDQIFALRWVRDNIAKFGGDPDNVTVAGESAGAYDISLLMTSPLAEGLFRRGIAESGTVGILGGPRTAAGAAEVGLRLAAELKAPDTDAIKYLRTLSAEEIMKAGRKVDDRTGLEVSIDGWVLPRSPDQVYMSGRSLPVPFIIGSNAQEVGRPEPAAATREKIRKAYGSRAEQAIALYGLDGENTGATDPLYGAPGTQWSTDFEFRCPAVAQILWHASAGNPTYQYEFERPQPGQNASVHAGELSFVFGTWPPKAKITAEDELLAKQVQTYWANFARTGNPNGPGVPEWPRFLPSSRGYMAFTNKGAEAKTDLRRNFCEIYIDNWKARSSK